jgi:hypothetical protein
VIKIELTKDEALQILSALEEAEKRYSTEASALETFAGKGQGESRAREAAKTAKLLAKLKEAFDK